jgi:rhodanese-related sulfurtransferase
MASQSSGEEPFSRITVEQAKELLDGGNAVVVDVRNPDEWVAGHVTDASHIQVDEVMNRVDELPQDKELLFICAAGVRSALACEMAAAMGVQTERLYNIEEGTPTWIERNLPTSYGNDP